MYQRNYYRNVKSKSKNNGIYKKIILSILVLIFTFFIIYSIDLLIYRGRIYPNVIALHKNIGKLNKSEANSILIPIVQDILSKPIVIKYNIIENSIIPEEDLAASVDVEKLIDEAYAIARRGTLWQRLKERVLLIRQNYPLPSYLDFDEEHFETILAQLQSSVEQPRRDAELTSNRVIPAQVGIEIKRQDLSKNIQESIFNSINMDYPEIVTLPVQFYQPDISTIELLSQIGINQVISNFETTLQGKEKNTLYNIKKASDQINGIILRPGENFLFNQLIGPAEREDGYKESTIISNGQFTSGYGGGICQVSTTLYNAALLANLQIIERYNHSIYGDATNYVPLGRDAAIFYGYKDLKFKNSLEQAIVIFCEIKESSLIVTIYGEKLLDKNITIITRDKEIHDFDTIEIKRENMEYAGDRVLQEGIPGYSIKTYRVITDSGGENMEFISKDQYVSVPQKILID